MLNKFDPIHSSVIPLSACRSALALLSLIFTLLIVSCAATPSRDSIRSADVHNKLAASYLSQDRINEAYVELQKALKLDPGNRETLNYLGYISSQYGKYDEAVGYYKRAISVDPAYSEAYNNLGVAYAEIGDWDNAVKSFQSALSNPIYRTPGLAYSNMGYAYYKKGDYLKAKTALEEALVRNPVSPRAMYVLGLVYLELDNSDAAIESFLDAIGIMPDYIDARWELANAYVRAGDSKKALIHFRVIAEKEHNTSRSKEALEYIKLFR